MLAIITTATMAVIILAIEVMTVAIDMLHTHDSTDMKVNIITNMDNLMAA